MKRKSVSYLMTLKADVRDRQERVHELAEHLEGACFDIQSMTTEEIRSDTTNSLADRIKCIKTMLGPQSNINKELKELEKAVKVLRDFL